MLLGMNQLLRVFQAIFELIWPTCKGFGSYEEEEEEEEEKQ